MPPPDFPVERRTALVIATGTYADEQLAQLRSPARDAEDLAAVLGDPAVGAFEVTVLADRAAQEVRLDVQDFLAERGADELLVVYLSCHGLLDARGRLYFAAADTRKSHLAATGIEAEWLIDRLDECRARRQVLVLDCCFSGAFAAGAKGGDDLDLERHVVGHGRGRMVLTASRARESAFEGHTLPGAAVEGSVFTAGLIDGLRTGGADHDRDGLVSVEDAYDYAYTYVQSRGTRQTPQRWSYGAEGRIWLARSPAIPATTPMPLPADVRVAVESEHPDLRIGAVNVLGKWLGDPDAAKALAARNALQHTIDRDIPRVALAARAHLEPAATSEPTSDPAARGTNQDAIPAWVYAHLREPEAAGRVPLRTLAGFSDWIRSTAYSPDGTLLAAAGHGSMVQLWDPRTGRTVAGPKHYFGASPAVSFAGDGTLLIANCDHEVVHIWDVHTGQLTEQPLAAGYAKPVRTVVFSPDAGVLAITDALGTVHFRDPCTGRSTGRSLSGHADPDTSIQAMVFSPDATLLALGCTYGAVRVCDPRGGHTVSQLTYDFVGGPKLAFSPDATILATAGQKVQLWDPRTGKAVGREIKSGEVSALAFSPDASLLATVGRNVRLWDPRTGEAVGQPLDDVGGPNYTAAFSPDGTRLAVANQLKVVQLWELGVAQPIA